MLNLEEFDFVLEESKIARYPTPERDGSKLMVLERKSGKIILEPKFRNIQEYLNPGDQIFFNETRVSPRRVYLKKKLDSIGNLGDSLSERLHEAIFLEKWNPEEIPLQGSKLSENPLPDDLNSFEKSISGSQETRGAWRCLVRNSKKIQIGDRLNSPSGEILFTCLGKWENETILLPSKDIGEEFFEREGQMPIPPYLKRQAEEMDRERYQTIFAKTTGSVAAPTAGLHLTEELRNKLTEKGVEFHPLLLEIGFGTFKPLTEDNLVNKKLHKEKITIPESTRIVHREAKKSGKRRIAIGTTTLRALEAMARSGNIPESPDSAGDSKGDWMGETEIFLSPGDHIDTIDGLITNFHLPKSSLILLVSAFAGKELILEAYHKALENDYRFFSYGDAMLII